MQKLTIVVTCTDRKSRCPEPNLQARTLPKGPDRLRLGEWCRRVRRAEAFGRLVDLYQGEAWAQVKGLADDAQRTGFDVQVLVASAGLGLRDVRTLGPAYAATFASGHADTVASGAINTRAWWNGLRAIAGERSLVAQAQDRVLLVVSESYARAMEDDLVALGERGGDLLMVGGAYDIDGIGRLPADATLRQELGGSRSSLNLRMARAWMSRITGPSLYSSHDAKSWVRWAATVGRQERYDRTPMTDAQVTKVIGELRASDPTVSATRALRALRDTGYACEQKRFGQLFRDTEASE